ncbi:MAG: UDP-N-acetylmuramate dehydrogenase [Anaerolineae bacterium]|nr:UDP-N-acetylmuramate dehydrogenase [Anaerolineae bacterium]
MPTPDRYEDLFRPLVGDRLKINEPLSRYTVARLGGPADALITVETKDLLMRVVYLAWERNWPVRILGGGANVLVSDQGYRGLVVINDARGIAYEDDGLVTADSGTGLIYLARQTMNRGLSGLEWAISVPGTLGGGIVNNAGAHGGDMAHNLVSAEVLFPRRQPEVWPVERFAYQYRESALKRSKHPFLVSSGTLRLSPGYVPAELHARADEFIAHRKRTQPPGASLGSMFKNPPGDYAGRLIEAAGLKGTQIGGVMISPVHANFFVNVGGGTAEDYVKLIRLAQHTVRDRFGVSLELEVELLGEGFEP